MEASNIVKYFEPGDHVRIIDGKHKGETAIVISAETNNKGVAFANIILDQSKVEKRILTNHLKLKSEIEQSGSGLAGSSSLLMSKSKSIQYQAGDMVSYNQNKNVGVILQVDSVGGSG